MTAHYVRYLRSRDEPSLWRVVCSCGWHMEGDRDTVTGRAATHDLDDKPVVKEPPLLIKGFVSGCSRLKPGE